MARLYSRKKGKSGSKRPLKRIPSSWGGYDAKVVEQLVVKLGKARNPADHIGLILRDSYGIPDVKAVTGKRIQTILHDHQLTTKIPEDITYLIKRSIAITAHLDTNKKDKTALRGLQLTESKIGRLTTYYKRVGKLPENWKYVREQAKLLIG
jgi:small subunit ribosomal protein S15